MVVFLSQVSCCSFVLLLELSDVPASRGDLHLGRLEPQAMGAAAANRAAPLPQSAFDDWPCFVVPPSFDSSYT